MIVKAIASDGRLNTADAIDAISFVVQAKTAGAANVQVINASWFQANTDLASSLALYNEVMQANSNGILFVAAAGNAANNNDTYPTYTQNIPDKRTSTDHIFRDEGVVLVSMMNNQDVLDVIQLRFSKRQLGSSRGKHILHPPE